MKTFIFSLVCIFILGCNCSPKPDVVTINGISTNTDTVFKQSSNAFFISRYLVNARIDESNKSLCLTHNKEEALPNIKNPIVATTLRVFSNQDIGNIKAGQNLDFEMNDIGGILDHNGRISLKVLSTDLEIGKRYVFSVQAKTKDSVQLRHDIGVNIVP
jgi:hypothetical protein